MAENKTKVTKVRVTDFIATVENETRQKDAKTLVKLFSKVSGYKAMMFGPTIIGFGLYHYTYESGRTGSACTLGFSPRKANLVIYVFDFPGKEALLAKLGKHRGGIKQCLYINKLEDIDLEVLEKILKGGLAQAKRIWPVTEGW